MKLHLPKPLQAALVAAVSAVAFATVATGSAAYGAVTYAGDAYTIPFESQRADAPETSVGRIMFIGDSITHGEWDMTWRWQLFKTFVDNGIENEIVGPRKGFNHTTNGGETAVYTSEYTDDAKSKFSYRGVTSDNVHYAKSSGRTRNIINGNAVTEEIRDAEGNVLFTTNGGASYGGNSADKVGNEYNCNTYAMIIGTNDLLSDTAASDETAAKYAAIMSNLLGGTTEGTVNPDGSYSYAWTPGAANGGHMGTILDELNMTEGDTFYVLAVPTWALSGNHNGDTDHSTVGDYNGFLKTWTENYNDAHAATVKFVDINKGLVDKTSSCEFFSNKAFFNNHNDGLHPTEQGSLIIAGNLAQAMGIGGRTGGLSRAVVGTPDTVWNTESQQTTYSLTSGSESATAGTDFFTREGGYTIDFNANFGDGSANGWLDAEKDHSDAQIITPSLVSNALSITVGDGAMSGTLKLSEGYILWHDSNGDNLLYCRDNSEISSDNLRIAYNMGSTEDNIVAGYYVWLGDMLIGQGLNGIAGVANGISFSVSGTGTGTVKGLTFSNTAYAPTTEGAFYANAISTPHFTLPPMVSHDNADTVASSGIDWENGVTTLSNQNGVNNASYFTDGVAKVKLTDLDGWFAAGACTATGNVQALVSDATTGHNAFAWQSGTLTGNVTMQFLDSTIASSGYSDQYASIAGSFGGASITGTFSAYVDNCTLKGDMVGGALNGTGTIGAVQFFVNSGTINGSIYGGSKTDGTVGNGEADSEGNFSNTAVAITINGGHIKGSVDAGGPSGTVNGNAEITINGGIIDHDVTDGSVIDENGNVTRRANQGKTTVTIQSNKAHIGGNITAYTVNLKNVENSGTSDGFDRYAGTITATNLKLDNYTAGLMNATLVTDTLTATNGTVATIHGLQLRNCSIDATGATALTLGESVISGNPISYSGNIRLEDGTTFTITNPTPVTLAEEGFANSYYIYKVTDGQQGSLLAADGSALTETHTATFKGTDYLEGARFSYDSATGALIAESRGGNYNIISSTVNYSDIDTASSITMSGGQLNLDTDLTSATTVIAATGGTVSIASGVTLEQASLIANGATKLAGAGTYALASGSLTLPSNISLDPTWIGTVYVTEAAFDSNTPSNINALAYAGSWVGLSGCTGWLPAASLITANLRLQEEDAVKMTAGTSSRTHTFSGSIAGNGDFVIDMSSAGSGTSNITYVFSGDVSEWTGTFKSPSTTTGTFAVQFTGTGDIGTSILNETGRTLNVTIGGTGDRTMNGSITNTGTLNLTVGGGGAKTFTRDVEATGLTVQANTQLTFDGELNLTKGLKLTASGASVVLNGRYDQATNGVEGSTEYDLVLMGGTSATINGEYTTTRLLGHYTGSTLTFGKNANVSVGGISFTDTVNSNGTLNINAGATVKSTGKVNSNILNLKGSLTVGGNLGVGTLNVDECGKLTANAGIQIGYSKGNTNVNGWVNLRGGEIVTTSIKGQSNKGDNNTPFSAFTMTDGTLTITGTEAFGLKDTGKKLAVKLQGGTIQTEASQMDLAGTDPNGNLKFEIGNVTFDTGEGHTIKLNHDFTQTGTLTVTGSGTVTFANDVLIDISKLTAELGEDDRYYYTLVDGGRTNLDTLTAANITGYLTEEKTDWQIHENGTVSYRYGHNVFYDGGTLVWNTTDASFAGGATFTSGNAVLFREGKSDVTLGEDIQVRLLTVRSGARVNLNPSGYTLTADTVHVEISGVLQLNSITGFTGTVTGEGALALNTGSILNMGTVGAIVNSTAGTDNIDELRIMSGTTVELTGSANKSVWSSFDRIVVEEGGMLSDRLTSNTNALGSALQTIVIAGAGSETTGVLPNGATEATIVRAALAFGLATGQNEKLILDSNVELSGDATVYCGRDATTTRTAHMRGILDLQGHTMTKTGVGSVVLKGNVTGSGEIVVQAGTLSFGEDDTSANTLDDTAITVQSGATLSISHAAMESEAAVTLSGGTLNLVTSGSNNATVALGQLTVNGETGNTITGTTGSLSFSEVTGSGDVTITSAAATGSTTPGGVVYMGNIHNYSGTMTVTAVAGSNRTVRVGTIDQEKGVSGTITGAVDSHDFRKTGEGSITIGTLNASGTLHMNYQGTLEIGSIAVAENTTLAYGTLPGSESGVDLGKVIEIDSLDQMVTLDVSAVDWNTLLDDGIDLGLVTSGVRQELLRVQGADNYVINPGKDNHWWLKANPDDLLWNNGSGTWDDTNKNWDKKNDTEVLYTNQANVTFVGDGDPAVVTIVGGQTASNMKVESGDFTFTKGETDSLSLRGTLTVGDGTDTAAAQFRFGLAATKAVVKQKGTLKVDGRLTLDTLKNDGKVTATDAIMVLGVVTGTGDLTAADGSQIGTLDGAGSLTTDGDVQVGTVTDTISLLTIRENSSLTLGSGATVGTLDNNGALAAKGTLTLTEATPQGGNVTAESVELDANAAFDKLDAKTVNINNRTLTVRKGTRIGALEGTGSLVAEGGTVGISTQEMTSIHTTGTDIVLSDPRNPLVLTETSTMEGGTLALEVSLQEVSEGLWDNRIYTATTQSALKLKGVAIEVTMTDTDTVSELSTSSTDQDVVLFRISDHKGSTIDNCTLTIHDSDLLDKYFSNIHLEQGSINVVGTRRTDYYGAKFAGLSANGSAGANFAGLALSYEDPQNNAPNGDLAKVLNALDDLTPGANPAADKLGAAFAGAGTAAMGAALAGDMDRQLRAVRNRTTTMGVSSDYTRADMPTFNAWINAEGDYRTLDQDGTMAGYTLNSWGGTVGVDVDFSPLFTAGLAATAMYGDLEADSAETKAEGDMDSFYVSLFARYADKAWVHTFVASVGKADFSMERTVSCGSAGSYTTTGDTSGVSFGLMYEAGYVIALDQEGTACLQPIANITYKHTAVDGYNESGSDAALEIGNQALDSVTIGAGARFQAVVGETTFNRSSLLELRALAKVEAGDRSSSADVALPDVPGAVGTVESAEADAFGIELGAGVTVPLEPNAGSLFLDLSAELRGSYSNVNGTFGYRINF